MYETPGSIAAKIRMMRSANRNAIIVVEGEHDSRVLQNFVQSGRCEIIIGKGKENVVGAFRIMESIECPSVLYFIDRDFDEIQNSMIDHHSVIYTDHHDLDICMILSDAFGKVLREFASDQKLKSYRYITGTVLEDVLKSAFPVGLLRLYSLTRNVNLKFTSMQFDCITKEKIECNVKSLVQSVINNSRMHHLKADEIVAELLMMETEGHELSQICVGEDVYQVLARVLQKAIGTTKSNEVHWEVIKTSFRLAFEYEHFRKLGSYSRIREWESLYASYQFLRV